MANRYAAIGYFHYFWDLILHNMNLLDIVIIALLAWGAIAGYIKGFLTQLISFGAVFLGIYLAFLFSDWIAIFVSEHFKVSARWSIVVASFIIFVGVFILLHLLSRLISQAFKDTSAGTANRIMGMAFGLFKSFLLVCAVLWLLSALNGIAKVIPEDLTASSKLFGMWKIVPWLFPYVKGIF
jgi:membrane protein required for colicin V production